MDLVKKGDAAAVEADALEKALVTLAWTDAIDFDLACLIEKKDNTIHPVYFADKGDLNAFPHMKLDKDAGVGDTGGENKETMRIQKLDPNEVNKVHILAWDYNKVEAGQPARFEGSTAHVEIMDQKGVKHDVKIDTGDAGNVCIIATIDLTDAMGPQLINTSKAGTLKGLADAWTHIQNIANR